MKALITGGLGEVGRIVVPVFETDIYDLKNGDDLWDSEKLVERMKGRDLVVHLAAYPHPFMKGVADEDYWKLNFEGTKQVVECMKKAKVGKLIFFSSGGIYGFSVGRPEVKYLPIDEEHPHASEENLTTYDKTKLACEEFLLKEKKIKVYIIRLEAPGVIDHGYRVFPEHLYAHCSIPNLQQLVRLLANYEGKSDVFHAGDLAVNRELCYDSIAFSKEKYPQVECHLTDPTQPLYSVEKAKRVLGYSPI